MEYIASFGRTLSVALKQRTFLQGGNSISFRKLSFKEKCMALSKINKRSTNIQVGIAFVICVIAMALKIF
jgi:hypothetical protein